MSRAIFENYGGKPTRPFDVAKAMDLTPASTQFRMITGASIAYGLTEGASNADTISITSIGKQILAPLEENDDHRGKISAFLKPRIISEFVEKYNSSQLPREDIAINVIASLGVPRERAKQVFDLIMDGATELNLISEIKGKKYLNVDAAAAATMNEPTTASENEEPDSREAALFGKDAADKQDVVAASAARAATEQHKSKLRRVFITHGKNKEFVDPIKKLLAFGELEAVVSVEKQSVSQPVPDKVMNDMRLCGAAIIHVDGELNLIDKEANPHVILNPNVLIEIGAAMALYGRRFILLVRDGIKLPSNLQGLYEVRYSGEELDGNSTIRLLEAIRQLKEVPLTS